MQLEPMPTTATWRHTDVRAGYEVLFVETGAYGTTLRGTTAAFEDATAWSVKYRIEVDSTWRTRRAEITNETHDGERSVVIEPTEPNRWAINGALAPELDGCVDVDLESSSVTNTIPIHRHDFVLGEPADLPCAFVRTDDLRVERVEQRYTLISTGKRLTFAYESPTFDFACELTCDPSGLVLTYPGIAIRDR